MNATALVWPNRRNSFHPAWLLLPLLALARLVLAAGSSTEPRPATVLQFVLLVAWVAPWVWWRSGTAPAFVVQCAKEIRGVMPAFLVSLLGPAIGGFAGEIGEGLIAGFLAFPLGCVLMAAGIFSSEFENRTLATFLGQPRSRGWLYRRKLGVLAGLLAFATANAAVSMATLARFEGIPPNGIRLIVSLLLVVFVTSPLFGMLTRNTIAGATFTVAVPLSIVTPLYLAQIQYYERTQGLHEPPEDATVRMFGIALAAYCGICSVLGWLKFRRLDATDGAQAQSGAGLMSLGKPAAWAASILGNGPVGNLVRKELRLQSIPWVTALLMLGIAILAGGARALRLQAWESGIAEVAVGFMGMTAVVCIFGTGATCVAEERQLGTHDWQLTQPATLGRQWRVKLAVTVGVALWVGCVWPILLARVALGGVAFGKLLDGTPPGALAAYLGAVLMLLAVSILASSLSKTTLKAGVATIGAAFAVATFIAFVIDAFDRLTIGAWSEILPQPVPPPDPRWVPTPAGTIIRTVGMIGVALVVWLAALLEFARRNYRRSSVPSGGVVRNWLAVAATTVLVTCLPVGTACLLVRRMAAAERAAALNQQWDQLETAVRQGLANGTLPPAVREAAAAGAGMSPREIAAALLREHGTDAFRRIAPPPRPATNSGWFRMDPVLMKRYGLAAPRVTSPAADDAVRLPAAPATDPAPRKGQGPDAAPAKPEPKP